MDDVHRERLWAQGLARPLGSDPVAAVRHLLAVQAQDLRGARLAVRARTTGLTAHDVDAALERGDLVVSWLNRGTLHLVPAEDHWWLHSLTAPRQVVGNRRRLRQEGVDEEHAQRGVEAAIDAVQQHGPRTRSQLREVLDDVGVPTAGQALVHVLFAASLAGHLVRGPLVDGQHAFVDAWSWCGEPDAVEPSEARARLARRYLAAHGPASAQDLAAWAGIALGAAREGLAELGGDVVELDGGLLRLAGAAEPERAPGSRLLGPFDPLLHGWASRAWVVGPLAGVVTSNGVFRASVLVDSRIVALWSMRRDGVEVRPLERIRPSAVAELEVEAADVERFLGREPTGRLTIVE
jgi:hypothetical protein